MAKLLVVPGVWLAVSAELTHAQRATMQVTVQVIQGTDIRAGAAPERPQAGVARAGADANRRNLTIGSVAPWQLLVTTESPRSSGRRPVSRESAGEGDRLTAGAPGAEVTVALPGEGSSTMVTYVLVTN